MARNKLLSSLVLYPFSKLYGLGVGVRNRMFDHGMLSQEEFNIPVVVVGNIAMGGTGKTPHVEYIIEALADKYNLGILSRGYKRQTSGFVLAKPNSKPEEIGDESYQIYRKYGRRVTVAVCEKRVDGIREMLKVNPKINMIILDDAFQHRYVKPTVSVVLTEYNRPVFNDSLLPYGRLREPKSALNRADIIVVTKCPEDMTPMNIRIFKENLNLFPFQKLFFSTYEYGSVTPLFREAAKQIPSLDSPAPATSVLVVTGIANPKPFVRYIRHRKVKAKLIRFSDHHNFSEDDMEHIQEEFDKLPGSMKYILTTEKDAVRLINSPFFPNKLKSKIFYIPVKVEFLSSSEFDFETTLEKTIRNSRLFN